MDVTWAAVGAASGLAVGTVLRVPVFRLSVPSGTPPRTCCPQCAAPVRAWPLVRCGRCGRSLGRPAVLEGATAAVLALLLGRFAGRPEAVAFCVFGALGVALAAIDFMVQRLPDRLTLPAYPVLAALLAAAAVAGHEVAPLVRAIEGGAALAGVYLVLALARPGGLGGGDVKLAGLTGLMLGWLGWTALIAGAALGFVLAGLVSLVLLAARRITLGGAISFGPYLLGGAMLAILVIGP